MNRQEIAMYKKIIDKRTNDFPKFIDDNMPDFKQALINLGKR